jgi:hypothetical protein
MKLNKFFYLFLSLLISQLQNILSVIIILEKNKEYCLYKEIPGGEVLKGSYVITGEKQDTVTVWVEGPFNKGLFNNKDNKGRFSDKGEFIIPIEHHGTHTLCFHTKHANNILVSFEFFTLQESGHIINLAKDEVFDELYKNVTQISYLFEEIETNLKFFAERKETHSKLLEEIIGIVQKMTFYKIGIIVMLSILQVYIIRKFFRNKKIDIGFSNPFKEGGII